MKQTTAIKIIVEICRDFPTKFGIPRQSGLVLERETLRDIEGYSRLVAAVGILRDMAGELASHRAAPCRGEPPRIGHGAAGCRCRSLGWHPHLSKYRSPCFALENDV